MSVSTESTLTSYAGDDVTTVFATGFPFFGAGDLVVRLEGTTLNSFTLLTLGVDYTVSGGQTGVGQPATGSVTLTTAPATGQALHIQRQSDFLQETDLVDNAEQRAEVIESSLDRLATYAQELEHGLQRAVRLPGSDAALDELVGAYPRRDTVIGFDEDGALVLVPTAELGGGSGEGDVAVWGSITGSLSDQADLQAALNSKASATAFNDHTGRVNPHQTEVSDLFDADISGGLSAGDFLRYDGSNWVNVTISSSDVPATAWGDVTGTLSNQADLQAALDAKLEEVLAGDLTTGNSPADGLVLSYSGSGLTWAQPASNLVWQTYEAGLPSFADEVRSVAFDNDGSYLAVAWDSSPYLTVLGTSDWSTEAGTPTLAGPAKGVSYSPDGSLLAIAFHGGDNVAVYDTSTWNEVVAGPSVTGNGQGVAFNHDGSRLAVLHSGGDGLTVFDTLDWSAEAGTPTVTPVGVGNQLAYSSDGAYLAIPVDKNVEVYDTSTWVEEALVSGLPDQAYACAFGAGDAYLAVTYLDVPSGPGLQVLDTSDWSLVASAPTLSGGFGLGCAFSPDGAYLAVGDGNTRTHVYDTTDWAEVANIPTISVSYGLTFDPDSIYLASGGEHAPRLRVIKREPVSSVTSVNGQTGVVTLDSDNISEGATNLYHTDARAVAAIKTDGAWNAGNWDTAFGWGDHAAEGYLTAVVPSDLTSTNSPSDGYVPVYDSATGDFTWEAKGGGGGGGVGSSVSPFELEATNSPIDEYVPSYDSTSGEFTWVAMPAGGGGADTFLELTDTPSSFSGADGQVPQVDGAALVFTDDISDLEASIDAAGFTAARALKDRFADVVHVRDFGAVGDGTTDDAPAIQSAIDSGAQYILLGRTHRINSTVEIRRAGVILMGDGVHDGGSLGATTNSTTLNWGGSAGGTMCYVSPAASPDNDLLTGITISGVTLDGNESAARGWVLESCRWCRFDIAAVYCTEYQIITGCAYETNGPNRDFQFNRCRFFARAENSAKGVFLTARGHEPGTDSGQQGNTSLNFFEYIDVRVDDGRGIELGNSDNNRFGLMRVFAFGTPDAQIMFLGERTVGVHTEGRSRSEWVTSCSARANQASVGDIVLQGTDTAGVTRAAENVLMGIDTENNVQEPVLGTGCTAHVHRSDGLTRSWAPIQLAIGDSTFHTKEARDALGLECLRMQAGNGHWFSVNNFSGDEVLQFRTDGTNRARFNFPTINGNERFRINAPLSVVSLTETSDLALKQNVEDLTPRDCLAAIRGLRPRMYQWRASGEADTGLVAQEVEALMPHLVSDGDDDDEAPKGVRYTKLIPYLIGAVQDLADALENRHGRL